MQDDDLISLFKAAAWADAKGALRKMAEIAGQARYGSRHQETFGRISEKIEAFIDAFEGDGLQE